MTSDDAAAGTRRAEDPAAEAGRRVRDMLAQDAASAALGIELTEVGAGRAQVRMTVRPDMVQGHGTCHGGLVATLADTAFAAPATAEATAPRSRPRPT